MIAGVLGLQGAFADHVPHLKRLGAAYRIIRNHTDLQGIDRLILPGGESTVMAKFLKEFGMLDALLRHIRNGVPVWGVCAGAILLAQTVDGSPGLLPLLPVHVKRNAYGRQLASKTEPIDIKLFGQSRFPAVFIRAPRVIDCNATVEVLARMGGDPVFVQYRNIMATTFHPELQSGSLFHEYFLKLGRQRLFAPS